MRRRRVLKYEDENGNSIVSPYEDLVRELCNRDPDEVVDLLELTTEDLVSKFPSQTARYLARIRDSEIEYASSLDDDDECEYTQIISETLEDDYNGSA